MSVVAQCAVALEIAVNTLVKRGAADGQVDENERDATRHAIRRRVRPSEETFLGPTVSLPPSNLSDLIPRQRWTIWIDPLDYRRLASDSHVIWEIAVDCGYNAPTLVKMSSESGVYDFAAFDDGNIVLG